MKKLFFVFCSIFIMIGLIGCGGGSGSGSNSSGNSGGGNAAKIVIDSAYSIDSSASDVATKYSNAWKVEGSDLLTQTLPNSTEKLVSYTDKVSVTSGSDANGSYILFESTTEDANGHVFFGYSYNQQKGMFDFTALSSLSSGNIGFDFDIDFVSSGGFLYSYGYNGGYSIDNSENTNTVSVDTIRGMSDDGFLNHAATSSKDNVYYRICLPKKGSGSLKLYGIYAYLNSQVTGFADMESSITGGSGATDNFPATTCAELKTAISDAKALNTTTRKRIMVSGTITHTDYWTGVTNPVPYIDLGNLSNVTIVGDGTAIFDGIGFKTSGNNVIFENITVRYVESGDGIQINNATYVKVSHCDLYNEDMTLNTDKDKYDELISIKNNSQCIVLSNNKFHDSWKTILVGSNDESDAQPDRKLIMHDNYIYNCNSRLPLYRGGYAHIYNNYFKGNTAQMSTNSAINCRVGSKLRIENNYFENFKAAIGFWYDTTNLQGGQYEVSGNIYENVTTDKPTESTCNIDFGTYSYTPKDASTLPGTLPSATGIQ